MANASWMEAQHPESALAGLASVTSDLRTLRERFQETQARVAAIDRRDPESYSGLIAALDANEAAARALVAALDAPGETVGWAAPSEPSPAPPDDLLRGPTQALLREALDMIWSKPESGKGWNYCREQFSPLISQALSQLRADEERWELTMTNKEKYFDEMLRLRRSHEEMAERVRRARETIAPMFGKVRPDVQTIVDAAYRTYVILGRDSEATEK